MPATDIATRNPTRSMLQNLRIKPTETVLGFGLVSLSFYGPPAAHRQHSRRESRLFRVSPSRSPFLMAVSWPALAPLPSPPAPPPPRSPSRGVTLRFTVSPFTPAAPESATRPSRRPPRARPLQPVRRRWWPGRLTRPRRPAPSPALSAPALTVQARRGSRAPPRPARGGGTVKYEKSRGACRSRRSLLAEGFPACLACTPVAPPRAAGQRKRPVRSGRRRTALASAIDSLRRAGRASAGRVPARADRAVLPATPTVRLVSGRGAPNSPSPSLVDASAGGVAALNAPSRC